MKNLCFTSNDINSVKNSLSIKEGSQGPELKNGIGSCVSGRKDKRCFQRFKGERLILSSWGRTPLGSVMEAPSGVLALPMTLTPFTWGEAKALVSFQRSSDNSNSVLKLKISELERKKKVEGGKLRELEPI